MSKTRYLPKERASEQLTIWIIQIFYLLNEMHDLNKKKKSEGKDTVKGGKEHKYQWVLGKRA